MQIKATICHYISIKLAKVQKLRTPNSDEDAEKLYHSYIVGGKDWYFLSFFKLDFIE